MSRLQPPSAVGRLARSALLAGLALASGRAAAADQPEELARGEVYAALAPLVTETDAEDCADAAERIASLGALALPGVLHLLESGWSVPDEGPRALTDAQRSALDQALERLGRSVVLSAVEERVQPSLTTQGRRTLLQASALVAEWGDAPLLLRVATTPPTAIRDSTAVARELEQAVVAVLRRDATNFGGLKNLLRETEPEAAQAVVRAIAEAAGEGSVEALTRLLGLDDGINLLVLSSLERAARNEPRPLNEAVLTPVRDALRRGATMEVQAALTALGALDDGAATHLVVPHLSSEHVGVRAAALRMLQRTSGLQWPADAARWEAWLDEETLWYQQELPRVLGDLRVGSASKAAAALTELAEHRLARADIARHTISALDRAEPQIRALACRSLQRIGSPIAVPALQRTLGDPDPGVRAAAQTALDGLATGAETPPR